MFIQWYLVESSHRELNGEKRLIDLTAPSSSTFIDVGANVGDWTELFLNAGGGEKRGLLIDPSLSAMVRLQKRYQGYNEVRIVHAATHATENFIAAPSSSQSFPVS